MTSRAIASTVAAALLAGLVACAAPRPLEEPAGSVARCTVCHGGADNQTGAPPKDLHGNTATTAPTVGAHSAHVQAGPLAAAYDCTACHPKPASASSPGHMSGRVDLVWGALATTGGLTPSFAGNACSSVYCHGATLTGGTNVRPSWTTVDGSQAACGACHGLPPTRHPALASGAPTPPGTQVCNVCHGGTVRADGTVDVAGGLHVNGTLDGFAGHPAGWMARGPDWHGYAAGKDGNACLACHAARPPAFVTTVVCSRCHDALAGGNDWTVTCYGCHGTPASSAPPEDTLGNGATTAVGVGAHQAHVQGPSAIAPAIDCTACHAKPANVFDPGHLNGNVAVTAYTGTDPAWQAAVTDPGWNRATATCATAYCHGAGLQGGTRTQPVWTSVGTGQAVCGSCHGLPPPAPHPTYAGPLTGCATCHPRSIASDGTIIPPAQGGQHLNGLNDAGHVASWMDRASPGFHAFSANEGLSSCTPCHGADLGGGPFGPACAQCHGATWRTSCTMCHGGTDNPTGAPPRTTWGKAADAVRVGAHTAHLRGGSLSFAVACGDCHVVPADALAAGHVDGPTATVTFAGRATAGGASPSWSRAQATCAATYCHGNYSGTFTWEFAGETKTFAYTGGNGNPLWTGGPMSCTSCHGNPPAGSLLWHGLHANNSFPGASDCQLCHPDATGSNGQGTAITSTAQHVNGVVEVVPRWTSNCFNCHL